MIEIKYLTENSCSIVEDNNYRAVQNSVIGRQEISNLSIELQEQVFQVWGDTHTVEDLNIEIPIVQATLSTEERITNIESYLVDQVEKQYTEVINV